MRRDHIKHTDTQKTHRNSTHEFHKSTPEKGKQYISALPKPKSNTGV